MTTKRAKKSNARHAERPLDIVLWGATGFTGELVARYLMARSERAPLRWAIAARSKDKLEAVLEKLVAAHPEATPPELLLAESFDEERLEAMVARTRVVISTVGPYAKYGSPLVAACVAHDTDYCDLTGEVHWAHAMIAAHHEQAATQGTRIVHFCGFDSIPSDLGTLMVQQHALATHGVPCEEVRLYVDRVKGGFSGGTIASMANMFEEAAEDRDVLRVSGNPYALVPEDKRPKTRQPRDMELRHDDWIDAWVGPFVMASVNTRVVRRSNAMLDERYGERFRYSEAMRMGSGVKGAARAGAMTAGMAAFAGAMSLKPTRKLLKDKVLPAPGEGPSEAQIERGYFDITLVGEARGKRVRGKVHGDKDPGYGATALMLSEAACCLAFDREQTAASPLLSQGGVLTPASAMGEVLLERLREAGMTFEIVS